MTLINPPSLEGAPGAPFVSRNEVPINAADYGVAAANTNNGPALKEAFVAGAGATVVLPPGTIKATEALGKYKCNLVGAGMQATRLTCTSKLGAGTAFLEFEEPSGTNAVFTTRGMTVTGPGTYVLGEKNAKCSGLEALNTHRYEDVRAANFDVGFVSNSTGGHLYWTGCEATNNYYGIYQKLNQSDFTVRDCTINGNTFAGFGCPSDQGWDSLLVETSHIGYQPFAFYQEATPENQGGKVFVQGAEFYHARFESLGNGCFYSAAEFGGANASKFRDVLIVDPGHSISTTTYRLAEQPHNYAIDVQSAEGVIEIHAQNVGFQAYSEGKFYLRHGEVVLINYAKNVAASDMKIDEGTSPRYIFGSRPLNTQDLRTFTVPITANYSSPTAPVVNETILADATAGSLTVTLPKPSASWSEGRGSLVFNVKRKDASGNTITIKGSEGKIDSKESVTLASLQSYTVVSDGTNYWIV